MAAAGSMAHFVLQPGVVAGLVPWWLTGWRVQQPRPSWAWTPLRVAGVALLAAGAVVLVSAFVRFVVQGVGTPAPVAPTQQLVVGGPYRHVRNPMYLAVTAVIVGQALALGQPALLLYAIAVGAAMAGLRPRLRGTGASPPVWRAVRDVPAGRAGLVAAPTPLATGPANAHHWTVTNRPTRTERGKSRSPSYRDALRNSASAAGGAVVR
jgi:hypothetical protein